MSVEFDEAYWEDRYHGHATAGGRRPNPQLLAEVGDLVPGTALDAGCGEGADAIWLASRGWRVTAVDIATGAVRRAREHAETAGVASRVDWVAADLTSWTPAEAGFDLVSSHYVHTTAPTDELVRRLAAAVAPDGTLLVVGHHPSGPRHTPAPDAYLTSEHAAATLDPDLWDVVVAESRTRQVAGHGALHDTVLRARRRRRLRTAAGEHREPDARRTATTMAVPRVDGTVARTVTGSSTRVGWLSEGA